MDIERLKELVIFEQEGTLSKTADKLHTTQPSISRNLQKLEYELGVDIFEKKKNKIRLNEAGILAVQYAKIILSDYERMKKEVFDASKKISTLSIGTCAPVPSTLLLTRISLNQLNTNVSSNIQEIDSLIQGLVDGSFQIIILPYKLEKKDYISKTLCTEKLFVKCRNNSPFSKKKEITFKQINGKTFLLNSNIGIWKELVYKKMPDSKFLLQENVESVNQIAENSKFLSFATDLGRKLSYYSKGYTYIPLKDTEATQTFYYVYLSKNKELLEPYLKEVLL